MNRQVFISYASSDREVAKAVLAALEKDGLRCWMAPRDVQGGIPWGAQIIEAIEECEVLVVVLSHAANESANVRNEVVNAAEDSAGTIIPYRIANVEPAGALKFHLKALHWIDAFPDSTDRSLPLLVKTVREALSYTPPEGKDLIRAVISGDLSLAQELLDRGIHPDSRDDNGFTGLCLAARDGRVDMVELLLDRGADIRDRSNKIRISPYRLAVEHGHSDTASLLMGRGAGPILDCRQARIRILEAIREQLTGPRVFLWPSIPSDKLRNARTKCKLLETEDVLALIDCTELMGNAKDCILFTASGIHYHGWGDRASVSYYDLSSLHFEQRGLAVEFGGSIRISLDGSRLDMNRFIGLISWLRDFVRENEFFDDVLPNGL